MAEREREEFKPFFEAVEKDPIAVFHQLADLAKDGIDPVESGLIPGNPVTKKVKSAERWAKQQVSNAEAAGDDWLDGVLNPSRDPIEAALAAEDKWEDRLKKAMADKKWSKNLAKSSHSEIVEIVKDLGTGVYTGAFGARAKKIKRVVDELQPLVQAASNTIQGMPDKTDAQREKRLLTARKLMIQVGRKRAGIRETSPA